MAVVVPPLLHICSLCHESSINHPSYDIIIHKPPRLLPYTYIYVEYITAIEIETSQYDFGLMVDWSVVGALVVAKIIIKIIIKKI